MIIIMIVYGIKINIFHFSSCLTNNFLGTNVSAKVYKIIG